MSQYLSASIGRLISIDVSTEMVERARARLGQLPNVTFQATGGIDLRDFSDASFDLVFSYVVFQHIPKRVVHSYFDEARRVLRPGGIFRAQVAYLLNPPEVPDTDTFTMRSWTSDELLEALRGWRCTSIETIRVLPDVDHHWITSVR